MPRPPLPPGTAGQIKAYKVKAGQWRARCRYRDYTGQTHYPERYGRTKEQAIFRLREAIRDWQGVQHSSQSRVSEIIDEWLVELSKRVARGETAEATERLYRLHCKNWIKPGIGALRMHEVTPIVINRMLTEIRDKSSSSNAARIKSILSLIFAHGVDVGAATTNPVRDSMRLSNPDRRKPKSLTRDEATRLLRELDTDDYARRWDLPDLVRVGIASGLRIGEVLALRWVNIEFPMSVLRVPKGKTASARRVIPLPDWCMQLLRERQGTQQDPDGYVFPHPVTGSPRKVPEVNQKFATFRERHGWSSELVFHTLRKTYATILDTAKLTAREIADVMGHSHPSMTQNVYMGRAQVSRKAADALEEEFGEGHPPE